MNKKLLAVAVAGALTAPAVALAQTSTVQIYGYLNAEYGYANGQPTAAGVGRSSYDALNSGASRIGFRGEEKLSGGMSAFWQCESDVRFLGGSATTSGVLCDRNSALGMKGAFGSVYVGTWDSPLKRAAAITRVTNETGWLGTQQMTLSNGGAWPAGGSFSSRNVYSVNYDTPNFSGFSASVQYTTLATANQTVIAPTPKGRSVSLSGQYVNGPLAVVAAYTNKDDDVSLSATNGRDDTAWLLGASYTMGPVKLGVTYADLDTESVAGVKSERKGWNIGADWRITGNGWIRLGFAKAGDIETGGVETNNGAKLWQIGYNHSLSKRTTVSASYARMDNDGNSVVGGTYRLTGVAAGVQPGSNGSAFVLGMIHTF